MSYIKNYRYWLLTESEDLTLPEVPVSSEESTSYIETRLNEGTKQTFQVVSLEEDESDDLFAVFADDEQKSQYETSQDPEVAEFIIFKPSGNSELDLQDGDGSEEFGSAEPQAEEYGFTYLVEDESGVTQHEEYETTFGSLDECLDAMVEFINKESEEEGGEEFGLSPDTEPQTVTASGFEDEGDLKAQLDAKKEEAAQKKQQYLSLKKGSSEREALSKEMIELNREIMELEKKLNKKLNAHIDLGDEEDDFGGETGGLFEGKKAGIEVKKYHDWAGSKKSKKEDKPKKK